jgi:hypothetical protein
LRVDAMLIVDVNFVHAQSVSDASQLWHA